MSNLLRVVRVLLILAGLTFLAVAAIGVVEDSLGDSQYFPEWNCEVSEDGSGSSTCVGVKGRYYSQTPWIALGVVGVGLVGAASAIGQFDRRAPAVDGYRVPPVPAGGPPQPMHAHAASSYQPHGQPPLQQ